MGRGLALVAFVFLGLLLDNSGSGSRVASESPEEATEGARFFAEVQEQEKRKIEENKQKPKKGDDKESQENVLCLTPFSSRKKGGKELAGVPWVQTTPSTRIAVETVEAQGEDLPLPPAPELPQPPDPPEIPAEVRAKVEEVKKTLGPAYNQEIEAKILESAASQLAQPAKAEITHGDLNKISQAKKQYLKAKEDVAKIDKDWLHFAKTIQAAYVREQAAYKEQRAEAIKELQLKKDKLRELQDAVRRSALSQFGEQEEVPLAVAEDLYPLPQDELEDMVSEEELLAETEVKVSGSFIHAPQPFGRLAPSPTRKAEKQEGRQSKKPKNQNAVASGEPGA
ncbi:unnamed protein product [Durusdinium trenchii]|uniref:Uncharacterized protein n=1 Tax=Durusdinium trenchii TaxID=1381693 RepID=A0ABP0NZF8_9DINO